ncbi:type IV secretion-system coupling protein DNA-binding domain protein [Halalkalicoccus paucihalophilus]|uniref:Type IV secretion-system coupling protein DNA-binding domain protein n=1 Tax=Halalkalicoccus paucihalophilus TaxID=1008153 RepID=A0A151A816_9EURY|nr:type IV secretion system DNA-binding domain-containing protein [Halalkalicoccus paucihalophilus]KYH23734.1 type IV secretion-system coupling protein DNA-binding domain protein [Halalkalicoccus paucihalophilus]
MVVETLLPVAALGTAGLAYGVKRKVFPAAPKPDEENFALPIELNSADAEDISSRFIKGVRIPHRSLLTLGASGAGKSETLKHFVDQLQNDPNEPVVVYDHKTDYQEFLDDRGDDMIRLSSGGSADENGHALAWNIFAEIETEEDTDELARALFPEESGDFWNAAGRQLFAAILKYMYRELENPDNADFVRYWERTTPEEMHEDLNRDGHEDLTAAASAINPETERQAGSVFATAQQQITDLFVGDFAESGEFSIREYMQNPDGRVLVLDYPTRQSGTIAPVFRHLIDQAIMHGMDDPDRSAYYLLDEIEHLDATIKRLGELINVGRGVNCQAILSLQSVAQLEDTYGKERAHALLSGMVTVIGLRTADEESVNYLREAVGTSFEQYTRNSGSDRTPSESEEKEEYQFAKGDLRNFDPGEAVICRQGKGWVYCRIQLLEE